MMRIYPGEGLGTVLMTNATASNVARLLDEADREVLAARPRGASGAGGIGSHRSETAR